MTKHPENLRQLPSTSPRRRRWWQVCLRVGLAGGILLALAYLTLPVWIPLGLLRAELQRGLSEQWGVSVRCGAVHVSWAGGVEIDGLEVASPEGFAEPVMLRVDSVRCAFAPLRLALNRDVPWVELDRPELFVEADRSGRLNVERFFGEPLRTRQVSLQSARISLRNPSMSRPVVIHVADLQICKGSDDLPSRVTLTGGVAQAGSPAPMSMRISTAEGAEDQAGRAYFHFANLDLDQLSLPALLGEDSPVERLAGTARGELSFAVDRNMHIEAFRLEVRVAGLAVKPRGRAALPVIDEAGIRLDASVDAFSRRARVRSLQLRLPGVDLFARGEAYDDVLDGELSSLESLRVEGTVVPDRLGWLAGGSEPAETSPHLAGPVEVWLDLARRGSAHAVSGRVVADGATVTADGEVLKPAGEPLGLELNGRIGRAGERFWVEFDNSRCQLGRADGTVSGYLHDVGRFLRAVRRAPADRPWAMLRAVARSRLSGTLQVRRPGLRGAWSLEGGRRPRLSLSLRSGAGQRLELAEAFVKPADAELTLDVTARAWPEARRVGELSAELAVGRSRLSLEGASLDLYHPPGRPERWSMECGGRLEARDLADLARCLPGGKPSVSGDVRGELRMGRYAGQYEADVLLDLTELGVGVRPAVEKTPGTPLFVEGVLRQAELRLGIRGTRHAATEPELEATCRARPGGDGVRVEVRLADVGWLRGWSPALAETVGEATSGAGRLTAEFQRDAGGVSLSGVLSAEEVVLPLAGSASGDPLGLDGQVRFTGRLADGRDSRRFEAFLDAGSLGVLWGDRLTKPADVAAQMSVRGMCDNERIEIDRLTGQVGTSYLVGRAELRPGQPGPRLHRAELNVTVRDAELWGRLVPAWASYRPGGAVRARLDVRMDEAGSAPERVDLELDAETLTGRWRSKAVGLDGALRLEGLGLRPKPGPDGGVELAGLEQFRTEGLEVRAGRNRGWIFADVDGAAEGPVGKVRLLLEYLDDKDLSDWLAGAGKPATAGEETLSPAEAARLKRNARRKIQGLWKWLYPADLELEVRAGKYLQYDKNVRQTNPIDELHLTAALRGGRLAVRYDGGLNGGTVRGRLATNLNRPEPIVEASMRVEKVHAAENIQPQIAALFPGNEVGGTFTLHQDVRYALWQMLANGEDPRMPVVPVGKARMVATDGVVVGRGAPDFVVSVFPGLNLTRYAYETMTGFTRYRPDGVAENEMIFHGLYDVYMIGETDLQKRVRYTVGLVLLGGSSPQWQRDWKQGRFPVLKVKGRIDGGQLVDETVSYPWPNETLFEVFLENNLLYRSWVNLQNRSSER